MAKKGKTIKIQLVKSPFGYKKDQIGTVRALGLNKMNQVREHEDNDVIRGMVFKVKHLVKVVE
jgi:large subunit ribosomal protein L30